MTGQDKLPVLAFPKPVSRLRPPPEKLARALRALQQAEAPPKHTAPHPAPKPATQEAFSPVGRPTPQWRAGTGLPPSGSGSGRAGSGQAVSGRAGAAAGAVARTAPPTDRDAGHRRIVSVHLPHFPMERWYNWARRQNDAPPEDVPVALATEGPHGPVIHAQNRAAQSMGIHEGARVVDMRALCPDLKIVYADVAGDRIALQKLMLWMRRWCPWTATDGDAGLVLDTTGSAHLWGGEQAMLRDMETRLSQLGLTAQLAMAPTHGAAWALARFGGARLIAQPDTLHRMTAPLPARALRLEPDTVLLLKRLGLKTVGDIAAVPRISLARRFSRAPQPQNPLMRLDQLTGAQPEPISAPDDPPRFAVQARLAEPIEDPTPHLPALCADLCAGLEAAGCGARRVTVTVYRSDGEISHVTVATARASRDPDHLAKLFDGKLEAINPGYGFDLMTLAASMVEDLSPAQTRLDGRIDTDAALAQLVDRLTARLGADRIRCPAPVASHLPERAENWHPALAGPPRPPDLRAGRPIRMFDHPEEVHVLYAVPEGPPAQFVWRRVTHRVSRFVGPERIAPEWWRDHPGSRLRDYYQIEDQRGQRYWIYRDGIFDDRRGETPRWFVHGAFA